MESTREPNHIAVWTEAGRDDTAAAVTFSPTESGGLAIQIQAPGAALTRVALRWDRAIASGVKVLGDAWERGYGDLEWRGIVAERPLPWYGLITDDVAGQTEGFGVETGATAGALASWRVDEAGITLVLDTRCGGFGVQLGDRTLPAAIVHFVTGAAPFSTAQALCQALSPAPRLPFLPAYGSNDWYYIYGQNSAKTVLRDAAITRELSPSKTNAPFQVIDAGWFPSVGCNGGPYVTGNENFPDLPGLANEIKALDVRPGIWIRPLLTTEKHPIDWYLPGGTYLDPSVPGVIDLVKDDIARLYDWGYELIKHDFSTFDVVGRWGFEMTDGQMAKDGWAFADKSRTTAEILYDLYRAIRAAAGSALLIGCNTVGHLGAGLFELQRTGDDTSGKHWERTRKMGINTLAFRMPQHNTFFAADADCIGLTSAVPWDKNEQWLDLLARSGTPLFVSADPDALGTAQRDALTEAFALAATVQAPAEPLDWLHTTSPRHWRFSDGTEKTKTYDWSAFTGSLSPCPP
jgi:alpha-galactosidase